MRPSTWEYPTPGCVNFQSATLGQFRTGGNIDLDDSHLNFRSASVFLAWEERLASASCHACPSSIINETIAAGN